MFKNVFTTISILFLAAIAFAANKTVMVDRTSNELKVPSQKTFWEKNISVFRQNKRIYVNMMPSISVETSSPNKIYHNFWTDTEIKVINKAGELLYFTTTINIGSEWIARLHNQNVLYDTNPTISYWLCGNGVGSNGCWGIKKPFTPSGDDSIGSTIPVSSQNGVTAIWIIPGYNSDDAVDTNLTAYTHYANKNMIATTKGELIKFIFDDPDNTVLCWRQNLMQGETIPSPYNTDSLSYSKLWRPCVLEPYGPIEPEQQRSIDIDTYGKETTQNNN